MHVHKIHFSRLRRRGITVAGTLLAVGGLLLTTTSTATAAEPPPGKVPPGDAWAGSGVRLEQTSPPPGSIGISSHTSGTQGVDVSHWQGAINWTSARNAGMQFAYIKATEGTTYKDPRFNTNYVAAYNAGVIRGAYHFARPNSSSGAAQANYFASNGGAWSRDNRTLPGALDIENNPSGSTCYGLSTTSMRNWITDFYNTYKARTTRDMVIYTTASWWNQCTGSWTGMASKSPLWVAHWTSSETPSKPAGWGTYTVWQYTSSGSVSGISGNVDRNKFNGDRSRLLALANNTP